MPTQSAELIGVASEQSGEVIGGASTPGRAGNGTRSVCAEDSAVLSDNSNAVIELPGAPRSTASRRILMDGEAGVQVEFRGFRAEIPVSAAIPLACKNVPVFTGSQQLSSR